MLEGLYVELTERCNLACCHCYIRGCYGDSRPRQREMSTTWWKRLFDEAVTGWGCQWVRFSGGEPLLRSDFPELYRHAARIGMGSAVLTNGTLLTNEIAAVLADYPPLQVGISLYGWDGPSFQQVTGSASAFVSCNQAIERLLARQLKVRLICPPIPVLLRNAWQVRALARSWGLDGTLLVAWEMSLHARHNTTRCGELQALRLDPREAASVRLSQPWRAALDLKAIQRPIGQVSSPLLFEFCGAALGRLAVDAYGILQPCVRLRHPGTLYDLRRGSLREALTEHMPRVRNLCASNPEYLRRCAACILRPACSQCPAVSWMETGRMDEPLDYYCTAMHSEARWLGILQESEFGWEVDEIAGSRVACSN